jgi:hypothetical protein
VRLALGVLLIWVGSALLWVAFHGLDGETSSPGAIVNTLGAQIRKQTADAAEAAGAEPAGPTLSAGNVEGRRRA